MRRRRVLAALGTAATGTLAGCGVNTGLSDDKYDVAMYSNRFEPRRHEVSVGDTVVWGNTGSRGHTVTAYENQIPAGADYFASGGFDSQTAAEKAWPGEGGVPPGKTYSHTVETPGEFGYFCIPHEPAGMIGTLVVRE